MNSLKRGGVKINSELHSKSVKINGKLIRCARGDVKINWDFHPNLRECEN